MKTINVSERWS